jgi:hypothetical protein
MGILHAYKMHGVIALFLCMSALWSRGQVQQVRETPAGVSGRLQYEIDITRDPRLGYVPKARLVEADKFRKERIRLHASATNTANGAAALALSAATAATAFTWTERGPYADAVGPSNGNTRAGNGVSAGRVRAIWQDITDATGKTLWVGGMDGGIWRTNDITAAPANWTLVTDALANNAIAGICQDPTDPNIMYAGTGEKAVNADAVRGAGIWMSSDHGSTWSLMPNTSAFWNVGKLLCDVIGNLYVGCNAISNTAGLQRYTKSTGTWTNITPSGLDPRIADMEISSTGRLHVAFGYLSSSSSVSGYRYTDKPSTVTAAGWTSPVTAYTPTNINVDLAVQGSTLYALPSNSSYAVSSIYRSIDGGANWSPVPSTPAFQQGQAWYNMAVAIDPGNTNNVMVGGLDCYRSGNAGTSWVQASYWVGATAPYVHADQQAMIWDAHNFVIVANDGGVFLSMDGGNTFSDRNSGLRLKQFYSVAIHPTQADYFLAGAQDNGVHQLNGAGLTTSMEVTGGDGAFVHIDRNEPQYQFGSYVYSNYRRSTDNGASWSSMASDNNGRFVNPTDYDDGQNIMYGSYAANTFARWDNAPTANALASVAMSGLNGGTVSAIKVSPFTANTVYFGGGASGVNPSLIRASNANGSPVFSDIIGASMKINGANISSIQFGTTEKNIIVAFSNYGVNNIWITSDGGTNWSSIDGNLPDMPVRWGMFYPGDDTRAIIATETGVWQCANINATAVAWDPEPGFPDVRTDMLDFRASDRTLVASTHGRGLFTTSIPAANGITSCGTVGGLNASAIGVGAATLGWTALSGALNYDVDYKLASASTWTNALTGATVTTVNLTGLVASSLYDYRVRANCSGGSGAYASAQFTTTSACGTVTGLGVTSVSTSTASISWAAMASALSYDLEYKTGVATTWTIALQGTTSLNGTLAGLQSNTLYNVRVRANCASGSGSYATSTLTTTGACPGPYDLVTNGTASGAAAIPFNTNINGTIGSSNDVDYYSFRITTGGTATITLGTLPANYNLTLYSGNGTTSLTRSSNSGTRSETISYTFSAGNYYIKVSGSNGANNASACYTLKVQLGTATGQDDPALLPPAVPAGASIGDDPAPSFRIYPNPAQDRVTIYLVADNSPRQLSVYDMNGKPVHTQQLTEMFTTLDLHTLAKGVYLFTVRSVDGQLLFRERVVRQ